MATAKPKGGKKKKGSSKMSAKKGKVKEEDELAAQALKANLARLKNTYIVQCKKYICEPIQSVVKRLEKAIQLGEEMDKVIITTYPITPNDIWSINYTFEGYIPLQALCLWSCAIDDKGLNALSKYCLASSITTLHIIDCKLTPSMALYVAKVLKDTKTIATVAIDHNSIGSDGACTIFGGIKANTSGGVVRVLSMRYCEIGQKAADAFASVLRTNASLTDVDLGGNSVGDEGLVSISKSLAENTTLTALNLSANNIVNREQGSSPGMRYAMSPTGLPTLPSADGSAVSVLCNTLLNQNVALAFLDLTGNSIGSSGARTVLEMLRAKKTLVAAKKCAALQIEITERIDEEMYNSVCDMNDVMDELAKKNAKATKGGKKGKKKGK